MHNATKQTAEQFLTRHDLKYRAVMVASGTHANTWTLTVYGTGRGRLKVTMDVPGSREPTADDLLETVRNTRDGTKEYIRIRQFFRRDELAEITDN